MDYWKLTGYSLRDYILFLVGSSNVSHCPLQTTNLRHGCTLTPKSRVMGGSSSGPAKAGGEEEEEVVVVHDPVPRVSPTG